mgnify:CR=1 FL=1
MMIRVLTAILCLSSTVVAQDYQQMVPVPQQQWRPAQQFVNQPQSQFFTPQVQHQWQPNVSVQAQVQSQPVFSPQQMPQVHYHYYIPQQPRCQQYQQPVCYQPQYYYPQQQPCFGNIFNW